MTGFGRDSAKGEKSSGIYALLVDQYVRVLFSGNNFVVGKLSFTNHTETQLQPYVTYTGTELSDEARIVEGKPAVIRTDTITAVTPLEVGKEYLEKVVADTAESNRMKRFLREKDLRKKGYFDDKKA